MRKNQSSKMRKKRNANILKKIYINQSTSIFKLFKFQFLPSIWEQKCIFCKKWKKKFRKAFKKAKQTQKANNFEFWIWPSPLHWSIPDLEQAAPTEFVVLLIGFGIAGSAFRGGDRLERLQQKAVVGFAALDLTDAGAAIALPLISPPPLSLAPPANL